MGSVIALLVIICSVYFIVLVGTVAYQLTGLDWDTAQLQVLSTFTMAGFTTRASERVVNDQALRDTDLRERQLQVLALERDGEVFPVPDPDLIIRARDHLVIYGRVEAVQEAFAAEVERASSGA
ncbi:MAG: putative transporter YbjL [Myxococcota bacterium]|jgi:uncharacterized transporter YbjL